MRINGLEKYLVEYGIPGSVSGCNTIEDLRRYLDSDPHYEYNLVGVEHGSGSYTLIWELRECFRGNSK